MNVDNQNCTRLRYSKRYNYPQSPLPCIKWWRTCLDEGQAIESMSSKVCDMTFNLRSVHKWAMTGTPIQKSLNDLYGILKFLEVSPYCHRKQFLQLMKGEETIMYNFFSKLIWRSSIEDVNSELNIPKLTHEHHWLTFSQIEKYFYLSQHDDCATIFSNCVTRLIVKDVYNILGVWLADLDTARIDTISKLKALEEASMNDLVQSALVCHLRLKTKKGNSKNRRCYLCNAEMELQVYESLLFSVSNKQKNTLNDKTEEKDQETMYESTSKGLWKMSQKEFLLMKLFQYGQAKIINKSCLEDAAEHMKVLELVRKEFRYLRLLWTHLSDSLSAHDEIVMAKSRLRLGDNITPAANEDGPPKKKSKREDENDVILEQYVDYNLMSLTGDMPTTAAYLEKKVGTLFYLENLKKEKENSTEVDTCPICCLNGDAGWAVLQCGHSVCNQCLATMCNHSDAFDIDCPMCRNTTPMDSISYVKNNREGEGSNIVIKGSFSTKIESVTLKLMELITQDPNVKVLIFSNWDRALNLLGEALDQNSISYRLLKPGTKYKKTLKDFKSNKKINALLMNLRLGSKGLNLTEATRIFFMEPIINKADEHQAIGRIHRIGQTKPTFVHNFIIRDSIEENITNLFSGDMFDRWDDITLSQLIRVFERNESNSILEPNNDIGE